ncbi:protein phosphatase 2C [Nitzschia inconspicua]|uniref:Protein phosphatase 2C n=1 Tax=Nitzschia inconspicua TaxID=303405 RepID=A0A9K3PIF6_9STRA|nr:protein phosphatase 2C [Nitzschia inconspicua]
MKQTNLRVSLPMTNHHSRFRNRGINNKNIGYRCRPCVWKGLLVFALVVCYVHFHFTASTVVSSRKKESKRGDQKQAISSSNGLPLIQLPVYPPIRDNMAQNSKLMREWNDWAKEPMIGSYSFPSLSGNTIDYVIHFPSVDLESVLSQKQHNNNNDKMSGTSLRTATFSSSRKHLEPVVSTRRGNKYSQGEGPSDDEEKEGTDSEIYRQPNQDRVLLITRNAGNNDKTHSMTKDDFWIGLFDGHGPYGHCVSQYVSLEVAKRIRKEWDAETEQSQPTDSEIVKDTIKDIFLSINQSMPRLYGSGSTGIGIWRRGNSLYLSNVGDSVAFVASFAKNPESSAEPLVDIVYATRPHKPDMPEERSRIEAVGGTVEDPPFKGATARLLIPMPDGIQVFGLAMSRSLGDHDGAKYGLIADPTTDVLDLSTLDSINKEYIVVAATDGIIDHGRLSEQEVAQTLAKSFLAEGGIPAGAAEQLIVKASDMWAADAMMQGYRDDQSIVVRKLVL